MKRRSKDCHLELAYTKENGTVATTAGHSMATGDVTCQVITTVLHVNFKMIMKLRHEVSSSLPSTSWSRLSLNKDGFL